MIHTYTNQEVEKIIIDESFIDAISWSKNSEDVIVDIDWCGQEEFKGQIDFATMKTFLHFDFVTELEINFKFKSGTMGGIEITSFSFESRDKVWVVEFRFDFHPVGHIKFNCNDFRFIIDAEPSSNQS